MNSVAQHIPHRAAPYRNPLWPHGYPVVTLWFFYADYTHSCTASMDLPIIIVAVVLRVTFDMRLVIIFTEASQVI